MTAPANTAASVICALCGAAGTVETDLAKPEGPISAAVWAVHFATAHPTITRDVSSYLLMAPEPDA